MRLPWPLTLACTGRRVDVPAPLGDVVGVADAVSRLRLLAADITLLCHDCSRFFMGLYAKLLFYRTNALSPTRTVASDPRQKAYDLAVQVIIDMSPARRIHEPRQFNLR